MARVVRQTVMTVAAGKRLIARALARDERVRSVVQNGTVVVIAGTTNGYLAEELLGQIATDAGFDRSAFFRGVTQPSVPVNGDGREPTAAARFAGDVVIRRGTYQPGETIFDVVDSLAAGDIVFKGANAVDVLCRRAAVMIGHPSGGTIAATLNAVYGRRVRLFIPVGLEKRTTEPIDELVAYMRDPAAEGPRYWPIDGEIVTELDAFRLLTGVDARLIAAGGVAGAEGSIRLALGGEEAAVEAALAVAHECNAEPPFFR